MAEYKNWYLAGGSGMKDERKKLKLIILQCIAVITANFITIWYFEELFFRGFWYVIFASFILTFIYIIRSFCCLRKIRVFWFAAIPVFLFGIYLAFLFNDGIKKLNFQVYKEKRTEIVQMVQNNQILTGYYHYYGITDNTESITAFRYNIMRSLLYCLNRRSQKKSYNWIKFLNMLDNSYPLVKPRIYVSIYEG